MRVLRSALVCASGLVLAGVVTAGSSSASPAWHADPSIAVPTAVNETLSGISCASSTDCVAVGYYTSGSGAVRPAVESLVGGAWTQVAVPSPPNGAAAYLYGINCFSATSCVAVGSVDIGSGARALVETLQGSTWTYSLLGQPFGSAYTELNAVSCLSSTACVAVGTYQVGSGNSLPLVESLSGTTWTASAGAMPPGSSEVILNAVSCTSATSCVAAGNGDPRGVMGPVVETLSGSTWTVTHVPLPGGSYGVIYGVSCPSATACVAVGQYIGKTGATKPLVESLSGSTWTLTSAKSPAGSTGVSFSSISCVSATACVAVGQNSTSMVGGRVLVEALDAGTWTIPKFAKPTGASSSGLSGVSCAAASTCRAVGGEYVGNFQRPLSEAQDGGAWTLTPTPKTAGVTPSELDAVSCPTTTFCLALGSDDTTGAPFAETWNGTKWQFISAPPAPPGGSQPGLVDVDCPSTTLCVAVGTSSVNSSARAVAELWNGTGWAVQLPQIPGSATATYLESVSCVSTSTCFAAGTNYNSTSGDRPLVDEWNGTSWAVQSVPAPADSSGTDLYGISCASATFCATVGDKHTSTGYTAVAETWNGTGSWTVSTLSAGVGAGLTSVACPSSTRCLGVGYDGGGNPLAEVWDGSNWTLSTAIVPNGFIEAGFDDVACPSTTSCTVVGSAEQDFNNRSLLAEEWDGSTWSVDSTANPHGALTARPAAVSCVAPSSCRAVGDAYFTNNAPFSEVTG